MIDYATIIRQSVSALEAGKAYGLEPNRAGFVCCPFHGEKTGSLKLYPENRGFHCFGCGKHGSVIDLTMELFGLSFKDAMSKLNSDFNLNLPIDSEPTPAQKRKSYELRRKRNAERERIRVAEQEYQDALTEWVKYDRNRIKYAPEKPTDSVRPEFIEALNNLAPAADRLERAEMRVQEVSRRTIK